MQYRASGLSLTHHDFIVQVSFEHSSSRYLANFAFPNVLCCRFQFLSIVQSSLKTAFGFSSVSSDNEGALNASKSWNELRQRHRPKGCDTMEGDEGLILKGFTAKIWLGDACNLFNQLYCAAVPCLFVCVANSRVSITKRIGCCFWNRLL